jgi:hypothetical protein
MNTLHHPQCQAFEEIIAKQKEEISRLKNTLKEMVEGLEFYGNWKNFIATKHDYFETYFAEIKNDHSFIEITENDGDKFTLPFGGKRARSILQKHKELIEGLK